MEDISKLEGLITKHRNDCVSPGTGNFLAVGYDDVAILQRSLDEKKVWRIGHMS